jgi:uncharacterized protein (DUF1684 family)
MLDLLDYRRQVFEMYRLVRAGSGPDTWAQWRAARDALFRDHPQSALDSAQQAVFAGLPYYPYDPAFRVVAPVRWDVEDRIFTGDIGADGRIAYRRFARVTFELPTGSGTLSLFWIMGYGGGLFLPFADRTNGQATYGAGRYLYDTIKGADLGASETEIVLDFNYAYHPSCAYNPRWVCPLAPAENRLNFPIPAGERLGPASAYA